MNWTPTYVERFQFDRDGEVESLTQEKLGKAKKIIADSITDHIIPQVSSLKTLKMFDSLIKLFEDKNIIQKMDLRK